MFNQKLSEQEKYETFWKENEEEMNQLDYELEHKDEIAYNLFIDFMCNI